MAADNNLTFQGLGDIEEMEAVGSSDSVNIIVQAEFSPDEFARVGATASDANLANFNTFRYVVPRGTSVPGPDGPVVDIGPQDMTDPATLTDFIAWAAENYAADRYALVLWNHGGGYQGLLEDHTHGGSSLMSLAELRTALANSGVHIDVLDFDMCLMGGVETAVSVAGLADYLVFSEENIPGAGNPYDRILARLRAEPSLDGAALAATTVDEYMAEYSGGRSSVTRSVFDMAALGPVVTAWDELAAELRDNLLSYSTLLTGAVSQSQGYSYPYLKDLGDFLDRLASASQVSSLNSQIGTLQAAMSNAVPKNAHFTASTYQAPTVSGSRGASVLLPSGAGADALPSTGPGSLQAYQSEYGSLTWSSFLSAWLAGANSIPVFDQGSAPLQLALAWDTAAVVTGVDVDLWVLEPNGSLFIPYLGVLTPNGTFSSDSQEMSEWYELYFTRRFVQVGTYHFFADLWEDPSGFAPVYNVYSRFLNSSDWAALYDAPLPRLSTATSWRADPNASLTRATNGWYTDLQYVASWSPGGSGMTSRPPHSVDYTSAERPSLTSAQWETLREMVQRPASSRAEGSLVRGSASTVPPVGR